MASARQSWTETLCGNNSNILHTLSIKNVFYHIPLLSVRNLILLAVNTTVVVRLILRSTV